MKNEMKTPTLHYIYDPMCGWCYAAAPLIAVAREVPNLDIVMHAGGMWTGAQIKHVTPQLRGYVLPNDQRIATLTGQPFGQAYFDGLLMDETAVLNSEPPIKAILAIEQLGFSGLEALSRIQNAHFVQGLQVSRIDTLVTIAHEMGLNAGAFTSVFNQTDIKGHTDETKQLMTTYQAQGFPTMLLQQGQTVERVNHSQFYGQPEAFRAALATQLN